MLTPIAELLERAEKALEGVTNDPWIFDSYSSIVAESGCVATVPVISGDTALRPQNAAFIAAARDLVPALAAALREAQDELLRREGRFIAAAEKMYKAAETAQERYLQHAGDWFDTNLDDAIETWRSLKNEVGG